MSKDMHAESPRFCDLDYSEEKMRGILQHIIAGKLPGGVLVAECDSVPIGMLGFLVTEHFFGSDKIASDLGVYVAPEHRGSSAFVRLVQAFEEWADTFGVKENSLGVSTGIHAEQTAGFLVRLGYERCGINLLKKVNHV